MGKIVLASSSPRRSEIMKSLELDFEKIPSEYVEKQTSADFSYAYVEELAYQKALDVAKRVKNKIVIGADTIVVVDKQILGKPKNYNDTLRMLNLLSGRTHFVVTSIAIIDSETMKHKICSTTTYVTFNKLTEAQIIDYIEQFKPYDKAGSYGIQELPNGYIKNVDGSLNNVIGLPDDTLLSMLKDF